MTERAGARGPDYRVHAALLFVQLTFGAFHVVAKGLFATLEPLAVAGLRVAVATPLLLLLAHRIERCRPARRHLARLALLGGLGVFANQVFYILGLARTTAASAGILMPSIPVFAAAAAALLGIERLTRTSLAGVALSVAGAIVLLDPSRLALDRAGFVGNLLILLNCAAFAVYLVLQRPLLRELPPLTVTAWSFLFGGAATLVVAGPTLAAAPLGSLTAAAWAGLAYLVLIPTALNYALNTWALRRSSPALVAAYTTLQPMAAVLLGVTFLSESVGGRELAGFVLIVAGLAVMSRRAR